MANVTTTVARPVDPRGQQDFFNWLFSFISPGGQGMQGLQQYPGQLNVDMSQTMLPSLFDMFAQPNAGQQAAQGLLGNMQDSGWGTNYIRQNYRGALESTGGFGGEPSDLMRFAARGESSSPGTESMRFIQRYGAPSNETNYYLNQMLGFGTASPVAGRFLDDMAQGRGAAMSPLAPFLSAQPYAPPTIGGR